MVGVALITGASRGIGAATALVLAEHGYRVVVNHRASAPQAEEVVATIVAAGGEAMAIKADVTVPNNVTAMVASGRLAVGSALKLPRLFVAERSSPSARERVPS